jgi:hypothetical protein
MSLKFKRHYKLLMLLVLVSTVLVLGLGDQRIVAYTAQDGQQMVEQYAAAVRQAGPQRILVVLEAYEQAVADVLNFFARGSVYPGSTSLVGELANLSR